ncbi:MAG: mannonate dehydratase [Ruminococcus sp.]|nr:mannonate dehydratase [Oscillospiraceae bacterium]MDD6271579.1 mannonate dehydratase [Ruminococcus sp.]MDD7344639.1 mannonate dehydratase [Ruminococcus sp.]MDY6059166.1 mannonate dehydratase [Candidatus Fimenecus sp.]
MQMTFRWFGSEKDTVTLEQIRQIPNVVGVVPALHNLPAGEAWELDDIMKMKSEIEKAGLTMECIESVNVHEDIKIGLPTRDKYIENYKTSIRNLAKAGVKVICYNFMPVFDWTRTDLAMNMGDGATCLSYDGVQIEGKSPEQMFKDIDDNSNGYAMPGWETERMPEIKELFEKYKGVTSDDLWNNLKYFLDAIMPVCEECDVKMAIHPDDPPWDIFGLPRIIKDRESLKKLLELVPSKYNGLTFCTGSLGASSKNDLPAMIREFGDRIYFAHLRNVNVVDNHFNETAHESNTGSLDMYEIVKALQDVGFDGYIRPDHGRMIWGEVARPGYGLYDRALGVAYLNGLWEAVKKSKERN